MTDLATALAAVGERAPDAPATWNLPWGDGYLAKHDPLLAWRSERKHGRALESLALRLAVRLAEAEKCRRCGGAGREWTHGDRGVLVPCAACSGTGKEPPR